MLVALETCGHNTQFIFVIAHLHYVLVSHIVIMDHSEDHTVIMCTCLHCLDQLPKLMIQDHDKLSHWLTHGSFQSNLDACMFLLLTSIQHLSVFNHPFSQHDLIWLTATTPHMRLHALVT